MKKRLMFLALIILVSLASTSCSQFFPAKEGTSPTYQQILATKKAAPSTTQETLETKATSKKATEKLIIKQKTVRLKVGGVKKTVKKVESLASEHQGYVTYSIVSTEESGLVYPQQLEQGALPSAPSITSAKGRPLTGTVIVKVPYRAYSSFLKDLEKLGEVDYELEGTEEVTEEYIDLQARIRNLKREEERYLDFLDAAKNIEEMLKVEAEISRVRGEIESLQAKADYLKKSAVISTVTVQLYETGAVVRPAGTDWGFVQAITQAIRNFVMVINFLIMIFGAILPFILIALLMLWVVRLAWRRRFGQKKAG